MFNNPATGTWKISGQLENHESSQINKVTGPHVGILNVALCAVVHTEHNLVGSFLPIFFLINTNVH